MKISTSRFFTAAALLLASFGSIEAQTMTGTVLTQPCNNNGSIGVTVAGLTPPINYTYGNWAAQQNIVHTGINSLTDNVTGLAAYQSPWPWMQPNIWWVTASDGVNTVSMNFTLTPPFTDSIHVATANCPAMSTVQAMQFVGGTAPFSCVWTNLNTNISYNSNPAAVPNGPYKLVITDAAGCMVSTATGSSNINVTSNSGVTGTVVGTNANCTNGTATVTPSGGTAPYTYLWSNNATTQSLSGLTAGALTCVVTDNIGCQATLYYYVQQQFNFTFNNTVGNATCIQNNGTINAFVSGGTAPYSWQWSNNATTQNLTGLGSGQYIAQVTDANGCVGTNYVNVGASTPISVTNLITPSSCTAPTGAATITAAGGATPYSYLWYSFPTNTTGNTISGKTSGTYSFKVTDANGCIQTGAAQIPFSSVINANVNSSGVVCPATSGNLSIQASGTSAPFTYLWSNSATTATITNVPLGSYNCTVTDAAGCSVVKSGAIFQTSPLNVGFSPTAASCIYTSDGAVTANATGGTSPYSYSWSNNQTGATITGLASGNYYVSVTDANGCNNSYNNSMVYVGYNPTANSCYCTITGTVYTDANNNCTRNTGENGIPNIQVHCSGLGYSYTDANGVYSFKAPTGTYTITESIQQIHPLSSCQTNNQVVTVTAASNCTSVVNFANNTVLIHDLRIVTSNINLPVPGNTYNQMAIVINDGTMIEAGIRLRYNHDGQLGFTGCTPWTLAQQNASSFPNWYSMNTGFPQLNPGANSAAFFNYNVPTNIPVNTVVNFWDTVTHTTPVNTAWLTDNTPWNNVNSHQAYVVSSYDPNFKEVSPKGVGATGDITSRDSVLTYVVHFQNTGSYYAQNIYVMDTLDTDLNITSLRPGYSDHQYTVTMGENGAVKFQFKNINLPWKSAYGDALSSGLFTFSVKLKKNLAIGTQIKNTAAIYFDYNEPVITNTTLNTLVKGTVGIEELSGRSLEIATLYPNPATNFFNLSLRSIETGNAELVIYDVSGRKISSRTVDIQNGENTISENTERLQNGIYFVNLKCGDTQIQKKLLIAK